MEATLHCALSLTFLATLLIAASGQACTPRTIGGSTVLRSLAFPGDESELNALRPLACDLWTLPRTVIDNEGSCVSQDNGRTYLLFEFWRLSAKNALDSRSMEDVYFLVARGAQPNVTYVGSDVVYNPALTQQPQLGQNGTMRDADADLYWRPYHRIVVPYNTSSYRPGTNDWFVTVANMDTRYSITRYTLRVSCVTEATAPCPRPLPSGGECSGQGTCVDPPQNVARPALNRVCTCTSGLGDYGCQTPAPLLGDGDVVSAVLDPGAWSFWQLRVPIPPSGVKPALLVELSRSAVGFGQALGGYGPSAGTVSSPFGGDPVLVVMSKDTDGSNRLPWFTDITAYGDLRSYFLQQNLHYVLTRDLSTGVAAGGSTADYYVAVFNNDQRFSRDPQLLYPQANVTIRVRWRTTSGMGSSDPPLCPNDCYGQGTCYDPWDSNTGNLPTSLLPAVATNAAKPADFQCGCTGDYGGTLCEGKLRNLTVSYAGESSAGSLAPGQWSFYVLSFDPRRFDYRQDVVAIQWAVSDNTFDPPTAYANAYLTIDENAFPRNAQLDSDDPFRRGWQIFYNSLVLRSNPPQPLQMKGSDLKQGYTYVLGVYNSDYVRKMPYDYGLSVYVPSATRTWLHPYMSVVLGVTASIILCLFMTLCRRLVQRYGWGPFRSRDPLGGPNGNVARIQVTQTAPRQQGVPIHVIEALHTYEYTASKAEKAQLARSRRDHDAVQMQVQQQASLPRQASLQQQGSLQGQSTTAGAAAIPVSGGAAEVTALAGTGHRCSNNGCAAEPSSSVAAMAALAAAAPDAVHHVAIPMAVTNAPLAGASTSTSSMGMPVKGVAVYSADDDDEPQCTVCLCEYEEGERITQLPCKHEFHGTCINKWLQTHYTCPICRISLLPDEPDAENEEGARPEAAAADGGQQSQQDGVAAAAGPSAVLAVYPPAHGTQVAYSGVIPVQPFPSFDAPTDPAAPVAGSAAAAAALQPQHAGLMSRVLYSMRLGTPQPSPQLTELEELPPQRQQQEPPHREQRGSSARGVAEAVMQTEPAPAALVATSGGQHSTVVATTPSGMQLVARGPSATLEARSVTSSGGASRSPTSARLAAGRLVGSSGGASPGPVDLLAVPPLRDGAMLPDHMGVDFPEPPGLSPASHH